MFLFLKTMHHVCMALVMVFIIATANSQKESGVDTVNKASEEIMALIGELQEKLSSDDGKIKRHYVYTIY